MALALFAHPFSSYSQKALMALYENGTAFEDRMLGPDHPDNVSDLRGFWPFGKFPVLIDDGRPVIEASIIIEHLDIHHRGPTRFMPDDPAVALGVRFLDRFFDNYLHTPMQRIVGDALRPADSRDAHGVGEARAMLDTAYRWLDARMAGREWAEGSFSLADCAAAPALFYADWAHPIANEFVNVRAYRARLNARPSFARCIETARPYRHFFPLGAPDRD